MQVLQLGEWLQVDIAASGNRLEQSQLWTALGPHLVTVCRERHWTALLSAYHLSAYAVGHASGL